ncbi:MAG: ECF-type sigma factor, partial [Acidobacteriota bacterium]
MSTDGMTEITNLLRAHSAGDRDAFDRLTPLIYDRLTCIARGRARRSAIDRAALDTVGLVHETWAQLVNEDGVDWNDRQHFFAVCSRAMRRVVIDHARQRSARKRGGGVVPTTLDDH